MYFITTKRMLEVCFSVHPNIQYRTCGDLRGCGPGAYHAGTYDGDGGLCILGCIQIFLDFKSVCAYTDMG